ncbi:MAG: CoA ester lyase [Proteobacteria bacterium]|nr:CoA ester lyase [Pseudomonadota bacterium]
MGAPLMVGVVHRPLRAARSVLFAPGNHERRMAKAMASDADLVVLDLEDAVPPAEKSRARHSVRAALEAAGGRPACVRINAPGSGDAVQDLEALTAAPLHAVVVPKVESAGSLGALEPLLAALEQRSGWPSGALEVMPIVETAAGVLDCRSIAAASPRVRRLVFGAADYTLDLDLEWTAEEEALAFARAQLAHASRVAGLEPPIDAAILEFRDLDRVRQSARNGRRFGFQGKLCLHPDQIAICHEVFTPTAAEVERARSIVAAFAAAESRGVAAIDVDGVFVDRPVALRARAVLRRAGIGEET